MNESIILIVFGGIFLLVGVIIFAQTRIKRRKCSGVTTGIVKEVTTDKEVERNSNGIHTKVVFHTIVEYTVRRTNISSKVRLRFFDELTLCGRTN